MSTVNMTANDKDFYGKYENDSISITRIRRLSLLRLLPKLIITFPEIEKNQKIEVKLGAFTFMFAIFLTLILVSNTVEFISRSRFTQDFATVLFLTTIFILLLLIEFKMYKQKFDNYI